MAPKEPSGAGPRAAEWQVLFTLYYIVQYYVPSIGLTFYNKWLYNKFGGNGLPYPLLITTASFFINALMAGVLRKTWACYRGVELQSISRKTWLRRVLPTGMSSSIDIGLSNFSLMFVTVSLYTMGKSSSIVFLLFFSFLFGLEKPSLAIAGVVITIGIGVGMFTYGDTNVSFSGLVLVFSAAAVAGLRWVLIQIVLQDSSEPALDSPLDTFYFIGPVMGVTLLPFALTVEGNPFAHELFDGDHIWLTVAAVMFQSGVALIMTLAEFLLVYKTSSLTLNVAGICKEIVTILIATGVAHDKQLTAINVAGLAMSITGISIFNWIKWKKVHAEVVDANNGVVPKVAGESKGPDRHEMDSLLDGPCSDSEEDEHADADAQFNVSGTSNNDFDLGVEFDVDTPTSTSGDSTFE